MENRRSYELGRTSFVTETLNRGFSMTCEIDFQNLPLQLVQVHVVDRVLGILWRAEGNEPEPTMPFAWRMSHSASTEKGG